MSLTLLLPKLLKGQITMSISRHVKRFVITSLVLPMLASSASAAGPCDLVKGKRFLIEIERASPDLIGAAIFDFKTSSSPPETGVEGSGWIYRFETYVGQKGGSLTGSADTFKYQNAQDANKVWYCGVTTSTDAYYTVYPPKPPKKLPRLYYNNAPFALPAAVPSDGREATVFELKWNFPGLAQN